MKQLLTFFSSHASLCIVQQNPASWVSSCSSVTAAGFFGLPFPSPLRCLLPVSGPSIYILSREQIQSPLSGYPILPWRRRVLLQERCFRGPCSRLFLELPYRQYQPLKFFPMQGCWVCGPRTKPLQLSMFRLRRWWSGQAVGGGPRQGRELGRPRRVWREES